MKGKGWVLRHKSGSYVVGFTDDDGVLYGDESAALIAPTKRLAQAIKLGRYDLKIELATSVAREGAKQRRGG